MNVPKLRFKHFSDDYQLIEFGKLVNYQKGFAFKSSDYQNFGTRIIRITDTTSNSIKENDAIFIDNNKAKKYENYLLKENDIIISSVGSKPPLYDSMVGKVILVPKHADKSLLNQNAIRFRTIKHNQKYLYNYLKQSSYTRFVESIMRGNANQRSIALDDLFKYHIILPSDINEENKVAIFLSILDKKIELQTKKIEDLKLYKKGLLINLFKDRICNKKLSQCFSFGKAGGTPKSTNQDYYNGNIPFLSISDMSEQGKYIFKTEKSITELGINNSSAWLVPKNSIIISMYASYGLVSINNIELSTSQAMFNIIITEDNSVEYIYYYLYYLYITNFYDSIVSTGTQPNLNAEQLKNLKIYIPPKADQEKMSNKLIKFDNKLNLEILKLTKLQELKKGLIQNMFV